RWKVKKGKITAFEISRKEKIRINRYWFISNEDMELTLDLKNDFCIKYIKKQIQKRDIILYEQLGFKKKSLVNSDGKSFSSEIIIPYFKKDPSIFRSSPSGIIKRKKNVRKMFYPGEEWLYFKISLSVTKSDFILIKLYKHLILENNNAITNWFFIRYYDPSPHLRIRLKTDNQRINEISNILLKILNEDLNNSLINDISINTYKRELTRYKYNLIKLSEL